MTAAAARDPDEFLALFRADSATRLRREAVHQAECLRIEAECAEIDAQVRRQAGVGACGRVLEGSTAAFEACVELETYLRTAKLADRKRLRRIRASVLGPERHVPGVVVRWRKPRVRVNLLAAGR